MRRRFFLPGNSITPAALSGAIRLPWFIKGANTSVVSTNARIYQSSRFTGSFSALTMLVNAQRISLNQSATKASISPVNARSFDRLYPTSSITGKLFVSGRSNIREIDISSLTTYSNMLAAARSKSALPALATSKSLINSVTKTFEGVISPVNSKTSLTAKTKINISGHGSGSLVAKVFSALRLSVGTLANKSVLGQFQDPNLVKSILLSTIKIRGKLAPISHLVSKTFLDTLTFRSMLLLTAVSYEPTIRQILSLSVDVRGASLTPDLRDATMLTSDIRDATIIS